MSGLGHLISAKPTAGDLAEAPARHRSIRARLLALALIPLGVVAPITVAALVWWGGDHLDRLLVA